uniref:Highly divergent homeobox n=1 Tax=Poecilia latipinna TaxID=48699 RepID=A0A3B3W0J5_9TELE
MDAWPQRRGLQTMNLRSVFTAEQQRILERYYENGMTNQRSKTACFKGNDASHPLSSHGIAGGLLSGALLPADIAAARNIQNRVHLLPPSSSFPALSSASSSPSSSSPLSSGSNNNNNNDVILTGIYSLNPVPRSRLRPQAPQSQSDSEISIRTSSSLINQALQSRSTSTSSPIHSKLLTPSATLPPLTSASGSLVYTAIRKGTLSVGDGGISAGPRASLPAQNAGPSSEQTPRIQQVFTLSEKGDRERPRPGQASAPRSQETHRPTPHPLDSGHNFSIAMETGNEEDEWLREEELANMAAQTHIHREQPVTSPTGGEASVTKGNRTPPATGSRPAAPPSNAPSLGVSAAPWVINSSRKRTLQDRTQFSDGDLVQLKRYWDRGMTSLGSVCREKIAAAANQLNVDTEIVKTWISNRRRKYRLMGIEIPPPKGGPAVFTNPSPGSQSPAAASPDEDHLRTPELPDDLTDGGSVCMSEGVDSFARVNSDGDDESYTSTAAPLANNVKIEVIDEDEEADEDGDLMVSDLEQMQNLLEFKHEEVQFLENELENQKQKYQELANFTESLLSAVRDNDLERQKELLASLPQTSDQDWDESAERNAQTDPTPDHRTQTDGLAQAGERLPPVDANQDRSATEVTEPSASEEEGTELK